MNGSLIIAGATMEESPKYLWVSATLIFWQLFHIFGIGDVAKHHAVTVKHIANISFNHGLHDGLPFYPALRRRWRGW